MSDAGPRPPRATLASVAATRRAIRRLALVARAQVLELTVSTSDALAVVLRLRVSDAAKFLHHQLPALLLRAGAHAGRYEGLYIEVDDAHGLAWANGDTRLGGDSYVRPSLSGCNPLHPPGPPLRTEQPCPG